MFIIVLMQINCFLTEVAVKRICCRTDNHVPDHYNLFILEFLSICVYCSVVWQMKWLESVEFLVVHVQSESRIQSQIILKMLELLQDLFSFLREV